MASAQPSFCLHNGQIVLVDSNNRMQPAHEASWKDVLGDHNGGDDDRSCTSSDMSDEGSSFADEDESDCEMDRSMVMMDASSRENITMRSYSNLISANGNRSSVSLSADFAVAEAKSHKNEQETREKQEKQAESSTEKSNIAKAKSLQDLMSESSKKNKTGPQPMKAIQRVSAQECQPGASREAQIAVQPDEYLCGLLETKLDRIRYNSPILGDYFLKPTAEHIAAWDHDLLKAIRTRDLPLLQKMHQQDGKPLQASNQFGESILHVCVRRGTLDILKYLMSQGVSPRVYCDYGRTPLHDAFWTIGNPESLKMAAMILRVCPEMLLVTDKRGFTPLNYVPRDRWGDCCRFLDRCAPLMLGRLKNNGRSAAPPAATNPATAGNKLVGLTA